MKTSTIIINAGEVTHGGSVIQCRNLAMPRNGGEGLAMEPGVRAVHTRPLVPMGRYMHSDGGAPTELYYEPHSGGYTLILERGDRYEEIASISQEPPCALARPGGFSVMTDGGPVRLEYSGGEWHFQRYAHRWPAINISAVECGTLTAETGPVTLTDVEIGRELSTLRPSDVRTLGQMLSDTYRRLAATASDGGLWLQPVAMRYHLTGHNGTRIYTSSPIVVAPHGWQCRQIIDTDCTKSGTTLTTGIINLSAEAYRIRIDMPSDLTEIPDTVKAVEICIAPQLHPVDFDEDIAYRLLRGATSTPVLSVALPGATTGLGDREPALRRQLTSVISRMDSTEKTVATIQLTDTTQSITLQNISGHNADEEIRMVKSAIDRPATSTAAATSDSLLPLISPPHSFTARCVAVSGNAVMWGDITPRLSPGHPIGQLCGSFDTSDKSWTGRLRITMLNGRSTTFDITSPGGRPTAWAPVVSYPHPQATGLEIFVKSGDDTVYYGKTDLTLSDDGTNALHVFTNLSPTEFQPGRYFLPEPDSNDDNSLRRPGALVSASIDSPETPLSALTCSHAPVVALHPAIKSQSSWDFSRCHIYAFTQAGIHAVAMNSTFKISSSSTIDTRGVKSARAIAPTRTGVIALCSDGLLLNITASRATAMATYMDAVEIGWDDTALNLWMLDSAGNINILNPKTMSTHAIDIKERPIHLQTSPAGLWLLTHDSLLAPAFTAASAARIAWEATVNIPHPKRLRAITIPLAAKHFKGSITITGDWNPGDTHPTLLATMEIDGELSAPVMCALPAPYFPFITGRSTGNATPDLRLLDISLSTI